MMEMGWKMGTSGEGQSMALRDEKCARPSWTGQEKKPTHVTGEILQLVKRPLMTKELGWVIGQSPREHHYSYVGRRTVTVNNNRNTTAGKETGDESTKRKESNR